jgi:hypothetical protein
LKKFPSSEVDLSRWIATRYNRLGGRGWRGWGRLKRLTASNANTRSSGATGNGLTSSQRRPFGQRKIWRNTAPMTFESTVKFGVTSKHEIFHCSSSSQFCGTLCNAKLSSNEGEILRLSGHHSCIYHDDTSQIDNLGGMSPRNSFSVKFFILLVSNCSRHGRGVGMGGSVKLNWITDSFLRSTWMWFSVIFNDVSNLNFISSCRKASFTVCLSSLKASLSSAKF